MFIYQNQLFENLENQQVIGYITGLITGMYLPLILRTALYWFFPLKERISNPLLPWQKRKNIDRKSFMWVDPASKAKKLPFYEFLTTVIIGNILRVGFRLLPVGISNFSPSTTKYM